LSNEHPARARSRPVLLLCKKDQSGERTVNSYALGPGNEQLHSMNDPWLLWLRTPERYGVPFNSVQCNWPDGTSRVKPACDPLPRGSYGPAGCREMLWSGRAAEERRQQLQALSDAARLAPNLLVGRTGAQDAPGPNGRAMRQPRIPSHAAADGCVVARQADLQQEQGGTQEAVRRGGPSSTVWRLHQRRPRLPAAMRLPSGTCKPASRRGPTVLGKLANSSGKTR
jgi:hypothetical protein